MTRMPAVSIDSLEASIGFVRSPIRCRMACVLANDTHDTVLLDHLE